MKNYLLGIVCVCIALGFTNCGKDDDGDKQQSHPTSSITEINATVANGTSYDLDTVRAIAYSELLQETGLVGLSKYVNGSFKIALPANINADYLESLDLDSGVVVSNSAVKTVSITSFSAWKNGSLKGFLNYESETVMSEYVFVDKDVTITGSSTDEDGTYSYNVLLKAGWNIIYVKPTENGMHVSNSPGTNMSWTFEEFSFDAPKKASKIFGKR